MSWRMMNDHMTALKATCSLPAASEISSSQNSPVDLRSKKKKQRKKSRQIFHSIVCWLPLKKKKNHNNFPNVTVAIYYVLSLFPDSPLVLPSFRLWLVCVSSMNEMIYLFEYDSFPLSWRYRIVMDSQLWGGVWVGRFFFVVVVPQRKKTVKK